MARANSLTSLKLIHIFLLNPWSINLSIFNSYSATVDLWTIMSCLICGSMMASWLLQHRKMPLEMTKNWEYKKVVSLLSLLILVSIFNPMERNKPSYLAWDWETRTLQRFKSSFSKYQFSALISFWKSYWFWWAGLFLQV